MGPKNSTFRLENWRRFKDEHGFGPDLELSRSQVFQQPGDKLSLSKPLQEWLVPGMILTHKDGGRYEVYVHQELRLRKLARGWK